MTTADTKTRKAKPLTPKQARTLGQLCTLPRDNVSTPRAWVMVDVGTVILSTQRNGEDRTGSVALTRADFEAFVRWYETGKMRRAR